MPRERRLVDVQARGSCVLHVPLGQLLVLARVPTKEGHVEPTKVVPEVRRAGTEHPGIPGLVAMEPVGPAFAALALVHGPSDYLGDGRIKISEAMVPPEHRALPE